MTRPLTRSLVDVDGEKNTNYRPCTYWASNYRPTAGAVWGDPASRRNLVCLVCFGETLRREICLFVIIMFVVCRGSDDVVTCGLANDFISRFSSFCLHFSYFSLFFSGKLGRAVVRAQTSDAADGSSSVGAPRSRRSSGRYRIPSAIMQAN